MKKLIFSALVMTALFSCSKDDDNVNNQDVNYSKLPQEFPFTNLATINGVDVINGGFGSGAAAHPTRKGEFYVITDRGPNTDFRNLYDIFAAFLRLNTVHNRESGENISQILSCTRNCKLFYL